MSGPGVGEQLRYAKVVHPGDFEPEDHYYPRVLNAALHPMVASFMSLGHERMATRYCHLHPGADKQALLKWFSYEPKYFHWAGADLFTVTNEKAQRSMIVIETNSCPSGQKSMPSADDSGLSSSTGYHKLLFGTFANLIKSSAEPLPEGVIAIVYDKNSMEASGYAAVLAELLEEMVYSAEFYLDDPDPPVKWNDGIMSIRTSEGEWKTVRACFRYVTQKPWNRFPLQSKTLVLNTIIACLAGGRNKLVASKAYDFFNAELLCDGLEIRVPETVTDVSLSEIPLYVKSMGWHAVVKVPYSNAGQGVYTITNKDELDAFMAIDHPYDKFIVQALVGNSKWSSKSIGGTYYHVGTIPNNKNKTYVADLRLMLGSTPKGYEPIVVYGRRAEKPLPEVLDNVEDSWAILGTNLSKKTEKGWDTETNRLLLMDRKDFNKLGIGIDELIDGFVQTVLASIAIDKMCRRLLAGGVFNWELFGSLNRDDSLLDEMKEINNYSEE